jgi:uncharacterized protein
MGSDDRMQMNDEVRSGGLKLAAHLAEPPGRQSGPPPAVVLVHGYPAAADHATTAAKTFPELADRISNEMGWVALTLALRGAGTSEGQFSIGGWLNDVLAAVDHLEHSHNLLGTWVVGFGTGGALAICAGAQDQRIRGVGSLGAPADFDDWASHPRRLLQHSRDVGLVTDASFPPSMETWARQFRSIRAVDSVQAYAPRPLLVVHGNDDDVVPPWDARVLVDAHGSGELRFVNGAGHRLRHDPRAIAMLLGWLDRQRHLLRR